MELAEEFRTRAQRCLKLAQDAPTLEAQTHWLAMAQLWYSLAQHAEERDAMFFGKSAAPETKKAGNEKNGGRDGDHDNEQ